MEHDDIDFLSIFIGAICLLAWLSVIGFTVMVVSVMVGV